ncbi:MAG: molybdopterin dinucleotide binding domain-containing protein [Marmoricola sp.]
MQDTLADGCRLIVIDPRRTHVAAHADWHLQPKPGHDVGILSAMIKIVVTEGLCDDAFVTDHVAGVPDLTELLRDVDVEQICDAAGIDADDLRAATRAYATAGRGYAMAGTGPNMGGRGTLVEYLVLVLETLLGHWLRAGATVAAPPVLAASYTAVAEAVDLDESWGMEPRLGARGLRMTRAGLPTAAAADEMIGGRIRALISWSGNPVAAFPDQPRVLAGLEQLDLLVQIDPWYSQTARLADYVIAPTMPLEVPVTTAGTEMITRKGTGYGFGAPYGNYSPPVVGRPPGSDLIEEWEFFYGILKRLGVPVEVMPFAGGDGARKVVLDRKPTTDELIELMSVGSRVPLDVVKAHGAGGVYPDDPLVVQPPSGESRGRLHLSHPVMMDDLRDELGRVASSPADAAGRGFHLVCRRANHILNTTVSDVSRREHPPYNPVFLNPTDMAAGGIEAGASVRIESSLGAITAIAQADMNLRPGVASMAFAYGGSPAAVDDPEDRDHPTVNELISAEEFFDPYTGQPRMTGVPVDIGLATAG